MSLYSAIQFTTVSFLYAWVSNLGDFQYLYIDLFLALPVALFRGFSILQFSTFSSFSAFSVELHADRRSRPGRPQRNADARTTRRQPGLAAGDNAAGRADFGVHPKPVVRGERRTDAAMVGSASPPP